LVMGTTTYGKGLVQQLFKISNDDAHIKLTTAKYYVPSGRCIQKPEKQSKKAPPHDDFTGEEETTDTLTVADKEVYYTNGGRIVYGGGGIIPDIEVEREMWKPIEINLVRNSMFFDYAIKFVADHPDVTSDVEITDDIVEDFRKFLKEKNFDYKTTLQVELDKLKELVASEEKNETFAQPIEQLEALIESEKYADFNKSLDYIKRTIKREIVASIAGERGVYEKIVMAYDPAVLNAIEILTTPERYSQLILADQKKAQLD
ncbi:MAG: S41 family peptidase, partial [candidate division Zixibacteria bacterium]|nr:S41 family peptidase [candidate division Zixibacteria bacterium]